MRFSIHVGNGRHHHHHHHHHHRLPHRRRNYSGGHGVNVSPGFKLFLCVVTFVIGLAIILFVNYRSNSEKNFIETSGIVVDYYVTYDYDSGYLYSEIVEFYVDGKKYIAQVDSSSSIPKHIGASMDVKYNPSNPNDVRVGGKREDIILYGIGGVFFVAGFLCVISCLKDRSKAKEE